MTDERDIDEREALAAEYALGVLDAGPRADAEALMARDPAFAAAVARWKSQLSPLVETLPEIAPPTGLWDRIDAEVSPPVRRAAPAAAAKPGFWASLDLWRGVSFASMAAAAALAVAVLNPPPTPILPKAAPMGAPVLVSEGDKALIAASFDPNERKFMIMPSGAMTVAAGHSMELWIIIGDKAPRSLGVIEPGKAAAHVLPKDVRADLAAGATLAISVEPTGGSPTGAPTGPVVATGKLTKV